MVAHARKVRVRVTALLRSLAPSLVANQGLGCVRGVSGVHPGMLAGRDAFSLSHARPHAQLHSAV